MGRDLAAEIPAARAIFEAADQALSIPLSTICFEGPEADLTQTVNTQPALVVHAIAALVAAVDAGTVTHRPAFVAGHSLGEYAALIAVNAVPFEDGVRLVREELVKALEGQGVTLIAPEAGVEFDPNRHEALYRHPAVLAAAVVAQPDERWGETPCAFVELKAGSAVTADELRTHCRAHLAGYKMPKAFVFQELPKTSTGKIQKFMLRAQAKSASAIE